MFDLHSCEFCEFEFVTSLSTCPRCGWNRDEGNGGTREPADPLPKRPGPGVLCPL